MVISPSFAGASASPTMALVAEASVALDFLASFFSTSGCFLATGTKV